MVKLAALALAGAGVVTLVAAAQPNVAVCQDVDECGDLLGGARCGIHSVCRNLPGTFTCDCHRGYVKPFAGATLCVDDDECVGRPCGPAGACVNTDGSYRCVCATGFTFANGTCADRNECAGLGNGGCHPAAECVNEPGGMRCVCPRGMVAHGANDCLPVNECVTTPPICGAFATCTDTPLDYVCDCHPDAFSPPSLRDGHVCVPRQCSSAEACHGRGLCRVDALTGDVTCNCFEGFHGSTCQVCAPERCGGRGACVGPSLLCNCTTTGWHGEFCDVCNSAVLCTGHGQCDSHADGRCTCQRGFWGGDCSRTCPADGNGICGGGAPTCDPATGICPCDLEKFRQLGASCSDRDECKELALPCGYGSHTCVNELGDYTCLCRAGSHQATRHYCADENECLANATLCHQVCINRNPEYECGCWAGYYLAGDAYSCLDIPNCLNGQNDCEFESTSCAEMQGTYGCVCKAGFVNLHHVNVAVDTLVASGAKAAVVTVRGCDGVNECNATDSGLPVPCVHDPHATCVNVPGAYYCRCVHLGYHWNSTSLSCEDTDECALGLHDCGLYRNTVCLNLPGSFQCPCVRSDWYSKQADTGHCENVNECALPVNPCELDVHTTCSDIVTGGYECVANQGWRATRDCVTVPSASLKCRVKEDPLSTDIDECNPALPEWLHRCGQYAYCVNQPGFYSCQCINAGFEKAPGTDLYCVDIDECGTNRHHCWANTYCTNIIGGFTCWCGILEPTRRQSCTNQIAGVLGVRDGVPIMSAAGRELYATQLLGPCLFNNLAPSQLMNPADVNQHGNCP